MFIADIIDGSYFDHIKNFHHTKWCFHVWFVTLLLLLKGLTYWCIIKSWWRVSKWESDDITYLDYSKVWLIVSKLGMATSQWWEPMEWMLPNNKCDIGWISKAQTSNLLIRILLSQRTERISIPYGRIKCNNMIWPMI